MVVGFDTAGIASDEEIARALQEQYRAEAEAAAAVAPPPGPDPEFLAAAAFATETTAPADHAGGDAALARRLATEERDAALARQLADEEEAAAAVAPLGGAEDAVSAPPRAGRRSPRRRCVETSVAVAVAAGVLALVFGLLRWGPFAGLAGNPVWDPTEWFQGGDWERGHRNGGSRGRNNVWLSARKSFDGLDLKVRSAVSAVRGSRSAGVFRGEREAVAVVETKVGEANRQLTFLADHGRAA